MKIRKLFGVYIPQALDRDTVIRVRNLILYRDNYFICRAVACVCNPHYPHGDYSPQERAIRTVLEKLGVSLSGAGFSNSSVRGHVPGLRRAYVAAGIPEDKFLWGAARARRIVLLNLLIDKLKD